jgi:hypothetical protein
LQEVFSKTREAIKFAPIYLLFLGLLCFIFSSVVGGGRSKPAETPSQALAEASDYYILRDVSGSTHFRPTAQELYDTVELLIRKTARPQYRLVPDFMSYGHFASFVTNGHNDDLEPAVRIPDIIGYTKNKLAAWKYPNNFFGLTDYEKLFRRIETAVTESDQTRRGFVFIITDGMPDLVGNESECPPVGRWFTPETENSFFNLVKNTKRTQFFILLLGGLPECSTHVKRKWDDMSQRMLKEQDLQERVTVRSLEGLEGKQIEDVILEDLARFGRGPSITVESAKTRLEDDQRKALDRKEEFSG